jgi:hypothetical protein
MSAKQYCKYIVIVNMVQCENMNRSAIMPQIERRAKRSHDTLVFHTFLVVVLFDIFLRHAGLFERFFR